MRGHIYTKEQADFIRGNYTNVGECVRKFNDQFKTNLSYAAIKSYALRKLKLTTRYRPWTKEMNKELESILQNHSYKEATKIVNDKYGAKFMQKQIQDHCTRCGIKRNFHTSLKVVDKIIKENIDKKYEEIMVLVNGKTSMQYISQVSICKRANNMGLNRPHRVWDNGNDKRQLLGERVTNSEYVRFIGNRFHRLSVELKPLALQVVRLQATANKIAGD